MVRKKPVETQSNLGLLPLPRRQLSPKRVSVVLAIAFPLTLSPQFARAQSTPILMAQAIPDNTLVTPSTVTSTADASVQSITGGTVSGNSLFHSFQDFSIPTDQTIQFQNDSGLAHIITRVTGSAVSTIDGTLTTQGTADFFLLNPNGIVFGPNAQLNIGGSFIGSTADRLLFDNGTEFSAIDPQTPPLLTVTTPVGLQYGNNPGFIQVQGEGHQLAIDFDTLAVILADRPTGLQVPDGKTFALIGGDVVFDGGNVTAQDGRVTIGAVGANQTVTLIGDALGWALAYERDNNDARFQDIQFTNASSVLTSGDQGGVIQVQGHSLSLLGGSAFLASTLGNGDGQGIEVTVSDRIRVRGTTDESVTGGVTPGTLSLPSSILAEVDAMTTGNGGSIRLTAHQLHVRDVGQIATSTLGQGNAGDITVDANRIVLRGGNIDFASGLFSGVGSTDTRGNGGRIQIDAERLVIRDGAQIFSNTLGIGNSGNIRITADVLRVIGVDDRGNPSGIFAETDGEGNGGNIAIRSDRLQVSNEGIISTSTFGSGTGGRLQIRGNNILVGSLATLGRTDTSGLIVATVHDQGNGGDIVIESNNLRVLNGSLVSTNTGDGDEIFVTGDSGAIQIITKTLQLNGTNVDGSTSQISSAVLSDSIGQGGAITIQAEQLSVMNGQINASTFGLGDAGRLQINANDVQLVGQRGVGTTGIFSGVNPLAFGNGGPMELTTNRLVIQNGAQVVGSTAGGGSAGDLNIVAEEIVIDGRTDDGASGIFASTTVADGAGGNIYLEAERISLSNGATISASNFFSVDAGVPAGLGSAGTINIQSGQISLSNGGLITTSTFFGDEGNIEVQSDRLFLLDQSRIETNSDNTDGGNIEISADLILALSNSDITANANDGNGGQVLITADTLLGARVRDRLTRFSDITATSGDPALNGIVAINAPDLDIQPDEGSLPSNTINVDQLVAQSCIRPREQGQFLITGRDAPSNPPIAPSTFGFDTLFIDEPVQTTDTLSERNILISETASTTTESETEESLRMTCRR